jgi:hypothetical protein
MQPLGKIQFNYAPSCCMRCVDYSKIAPIFSCINLMSCLPLRHNVTAGVVQSPTINSLVRLNDVSQPRTPPLCFPSPNCANPCQPRPDDLPPLAEHHQTIRRPILLRWPPTTSVLVTHPGISVEKQVATLPPPTRPNATAKTTVSIARLETLRLESYRYERIAEIAGLLVQVLLKMALETSTTKAVALHGRDHD